MNFALGHFPRTFPSASRLSRVFVAVEDPMDAITLEQFLHDADYADITVTTDMRKVPGILDAHVFDLLIIDMHSALVDANALLHALPKNTLNGEMEILALVNPGHEPSRLNALVAGAYDTVVRPLERQSLIAKVDAALRPALPHLEFRGE